MFTLTLHQRSPIHPGGGLFPHLVQWSSQWGLDPSSPPPLHPDGKAAGWQKKKQKVIKEYNFPTFCRRTGWEGLLQLSTLSCASFGVLILDQRCSMNTVHAYQLCHSLWQRFSFIYGHDKKGDFSVIAMSRCAVCFAPYFYESEQCMAYPTSQMGWIIMERLVSHCYAVCEFCMS